MILSERTLLARLRELVGQANRIDIATAWAGPGKAEEAILGSGAQIRAVVGITGFATHPAMLRKFQRSGVDLRIPPTRPLFHPKLILFHLADRTVCWIGSANLTFGGYETNQELVAEQTDDGSAVAWFEALWRSLSDEDVDARVQVYEENWRPPRPERGMGYDQVLDGVVPRHPSSVLAEVEDWRSFVAALETAEVYFSNTYYWSVFGDVASWLNTIKLGNAIVRREGWDTFSYNEYRVLMGIELAKEESGYGLLGSMRGAGRAKEIFLQDTSETRRIRRKIRVLLVPVLQADQDGFPVAAATFLEQILNIERIGGSVATRLLTLARPDLGVSVNKGSRDQLAGYAGLPAGRLALPPRPNRSVSYASLLQRLATKAWYQNPQPMSPFEQTVADARGALLDALVYRP